MTGGPGVNIMMITHSRSGTELTPHHITSHQAWIDRNSLPTHPRNRTWWSGGKTKEIWVDGGVTLSLCHSVILSYDNQRSELLSAPAPPHWRWSWFQTVPGLAWPNNGQYLLCLYQSGPLSLVEEYRGSSLIGRELPQWCWRQQSYAIKNQLGYPKTRFFMA